MVKQLTNIDLGTSIIIPNFNGRDLLEKNLPSIMESFHNPDNHILEVILVDDGSQDFSIKFLRSNYPEIKIIRHKINRGFSAAVNTGARSAKGQLLALINNDVRVESNFLTDVIPYFNNPEIFAVSLHEKDYGWAKGRFENGFIVHNGGGETRTSHETFWVNGGSGVFSREKWLRLGGMDEKLFSPFYWEDIDISYRAWKRGWKCIWEPKAKVFHEHESTTKKISENYRHKIQERNQLIFIWKNISSPNLFRKHLRGLLKRLRKHPGYIRIILSAVINLPSIVKARQREKKESRISDEAVLSRF